MSITVILGEPMCRDVGVRETEIEFLDHDMASPFTIGGLAERLGITLADSEGTLLVTVNGEIVHFAAPDEFILQDGDHIELHMMLSGG